MFDRPKCPYLNCKYRLRGRTGLQELKNLIRHFKKKHKEDIMLLDAVEIRLIAERAFEKEERYGDKRG